MCVVWWAWLAPSLVGCPALSWADAAGCRLVRPGQELAGCGILGDPRVNAGSPVGRVRVPKTLGLWPTHWEVSQVLGLVPDYRQAELVPGVWLQDQGSQSSFRSLLVGAGGGPAPDTVGYGGRHWPASGQGCGPAGPRAGSGLHCGISNIVSSLLASAFW